MDGVSIGITVSVGKTLESVFTPTKQ